MALAAALSAPAQGLRGVWADTDALYPATAPLPAGPDTLRLTAWRGETVSARALLSSPETIENVTVTASEPWARAAMVGYVTTDDMRSCGAHDFSLPAWEVADIIGLPGEAMPIVADSLRAVWLRLDVPRSARPGVYPLTLTVADTLRLPLELTVLPQTLAEPKDWAFHTDFWQQPYAVSRYLGLERWSPEHFEALKPYLAELARSGQKVATAILFYEPWGDQSHDKFSPMVETTRLPDGSWSFDYTIFDRYAALCEEAGIDRQINCYSMIPWDMQFRYRDLPSGEYKTLATPTGTEAYADLWGAFLRDFERHLRETGRLERTAIAMDERGLGAMLDARALLEKEAPGLKMALAGWHHPELVDFLYDYSLDFGGSFTSEELAARRNSGKISTFYTCCSTPRPNIFSNSDPSDAAWLPLWAAGQGLDGYLHWSWMNWPDDPLGDSRFRLFAPGDTYLFYPGPRSSVRYERYVEGVQLAEKIRALRAAGADMTAIDAALGRLDPKQPTAPQVNEIKNLINLISK